jgi:uncharacterized protein YhfF
MAPLPSVDVVIAELERRGIALPPGNVRVDAYGHSAEQSRELLELILQGRKRASTSLLWAIEADKDRLPNAGDVEVVVDHNHVPVLITRLTHVDVLAFDDVPSQHASAEGEEDGSLSSWRRIHWEFFSRECRRMGRLPDTRMPVVCSTFELVSVVPAA